MDDFTNVNNTDNEPINIEPVSNETSNNEPISNEQVGNETADSIPATDETVVNDTVNGEPASAPADTRYAGYADSSITWNGTSYSGRPQQNETAYNYAIPNPQPGANPYASSDGITRNYRFVSEPVMKPAPVAAPKKGMPKAVAVILLALLFGIVSAGTFIGANAIYYSLNPDSAPAPIIIENNSKNSHNDNYRDSEHISQTRPGIIPSTDIISNVNASATDVSGVVDNAMPSIVSIDCTFNVQSFFGYYEAPGAGSGIILRQTDTELLVATNNHVVSNATSINVTFADGSTAPATTKGTDSVADLAVVAVDISELSAETLKQIKVATMGDSDSIKVGQMVVAIGNALGYGQSTTVGYVSAKDREVEVDGNQMTLLQTDAAINPGNSGGALLNLDCEVIGINSVKYADSDVEGMGFAIPISRAIDILDELANREILKDEEKGYLGIYMTDVTSDLAEYYNMPVGVYVGEVTEGCAAEAAGIEAGDVIIAINGHQVLTSTDLKNEVTGYRVGTTITITYMRRQRGTYQEFTVNATLGQNPEFAN